MSGGILKTRTDAQQEQPTNSGHSRAELLSDEAPFGAHDDSLKRGLNNRHIQMIALGGTIGVGLFMGSGGAIHRAGPSLLLAYIPAGLAIFFILRALAEVAINKPIAGSFAAYAREHLGPFTGFATGWTYWFAWTATCMAELTAMGIYVEFWFPSVPHWVTGLAVLALLLAMNLLTVKIFGEAEFWFATIKIVAIIGLIVMGLAVLVAGIGSLGDKASVSNLWNHGGLFPNGPLQTLIALQTVMFAFFGLEMIGVAAGEAQNPEKTIPKAVNRAVVRVFVFYIGALFIIMTLIPWHELDGAHSPFVTVFSQIGIPAAATVMNFVVLTAALSSSNSGLFSCGRMMYSLAHVRQAPAALGKVNRRNAPSAGIFLTTGVILLGVLVNILVPDRAFIHITSVATLGGLWTWGVIIVTHLRYRQSVARGLSTPSSFKMPLFPWSNYFVLGFLGLVAILLGFSAETRVALFVAPLWITVVVVSYRVLLRSERRKGNGQEDNRQDHETHTGVLPSGAGEREAVKN